MTTIKELNQRKEAIQAQPAENTLSGTFEGRLLEELKIKGQKEGKNVFLERGRFGHDVFHFGNQSATKITRLESGKIGRPYTNMLDLQKAWWREVFLEKGMQGRLDQIGVFAPSVYECIKFQDPQAAEKFTLKKIVQKIGITQEGFNEEYNEPQIFNFSVPELIELTEKIKKFLEPIVSPNFTLEFGLGGGDLYRKLRLVPQTEEAKKALIDGGQIFTETVNKIIASHDQLIDHLVK